MFNFILLWSWSCIGLVITSKLPRNQAQIQNQYASEVVIGYFDLRTLPAIVLILIQFFLEQMVAWEVLDAECDEETRQAKDIGCLTSLYEVVKLTYFHPSEQVSHTLHYNFPPWIDNVCNSILIVVWNMAEQNFTTSVLVLSHFYQLLYVFQPFQNCVYCNHHFRVQCFSWTKNCLNICITVVIHFVLTTVASQLLHISYFHYRF